MAGKLERRVTFRLDNTTRTALRLLCRIERVNQSQIIRDAVQAYIGRVVAGQEE